MMTDLLAVNITTPLVVGTATTVAAVLFVVLLLHTITRWIAHAALTLGLGALLGVVLIWLITDVFNIFGIRFSTITVLWVSALCASLALAALNFRHSKLWRKITAAISLVVFVVTAGLGINADIGLNRTLGSLMGISTAKEIRLPEITSPSATPTEPLWTHRKPPSDMPDKGLQGKKRIPATASGFVARDAGIYLPPAAQVTNPPQLPLVIMLMGQPGNPDPADIASVLDGFAGKNKGLAPIVIVADQIGPGQNDTGCLDTDRYGNVETYIIKDVVNYAKSQLNILQEPKYWTIAGYSNGGQCAVSLGAKHQNVFGNILSISGEEFPGAENPKATLNDLFNGNQAAYDAQKPVALLAKNRFEDTTAVFTVGANDTPYKPAAQKLYQAATQSGMATTYHEVSNAGHLADALQGGLEKGFDVLYPRLGLSP